MICIYAPYTQNILSSENFLVKKISAGEGRWPKKLIQMLK
jgi:hypothetical protein